MLAFHCSNLCVCFGERDVLKNISFGISEGDRVGIVGTNGAGKTTLLRTMTGQIAPNSGELHYAKQSQIGYLDQQVNFDENATVYEEMLKTFPTLIEQENQLAIMQKEMEQSHNLTLIARYTAAQERFQANGGYEFRQRCKSILQNFGFYKKEQSALISTLSGGQKSKLALARLLLQTPDLLLLDEPTNHLDIRTISWLEEYLISYPKTVVVISHDRYFLDKITTKTLELEHGHAKIYLGNYSYYREQKAKDYEIQLHQYTSQQREIARQEAYIKQQRQWNRERNIIAANSRQKMLDKMEKIEKPTTEDDGIRLRFCEDIESGELVFCAENLTKSYDSKKIIDKLTLKLRKKDRLFVLGPNGCGKSTLIKMIAQRLKADFGTVEYGYHVKVGYYDQESQNLTPENTVLEELWKENPLVSETEIRTTLSFLLFFGDDVYKKVSQLSGGERARLTLAKLMFQKTNLLILDEPTNHLDLKSKEMLEQALSLYQGTILAISHDRYFTNRLATRIFSFPDAVQGSYFDFKGTYAEYEDYQKRNATPIIDSTTLTSQVVSAGKMQYLESKQKQSDEKKKKRQIESLELKIQQTEDLISELKKEMELCPTEYTKLCELDVALKEQQSSLEALYSTWDQLQQN